MSCGLQVGEFSRVVPNPMVPYFPCQQRLIENGRSGCQIEILEKGHNCYSDHDHHNFRPNQTHSCHDHANNYDGHGHHTKHKIYNDDDDAAARSYSYTSLQILLILCQGL